MPKNTRHTVAGLAIAAPLYDFVENEALVGSGITAGEFWSGAAEIIQDFAPGNRALLARRDELQARIDDFHRAAPGTPDADQYRSFLEEIGYLLVDDAELTVSTDGVDTEITAQCGPQLVVPLLNRRFAANAVNARWGSLYDALYGTDAIDRAGELAPTEEYNPLRGAAVVSEVRRLLDQFVPLADGSHRDSTAYTVVAGALQVALGDSTSALADPACFLGYRGDPEAPAALVFRHHGLHVELLIDRAHPIGALDRAGVKDVRLESAVTTIMDLEDSVAAVDAHDKVLGYRNWLQLMQGTLTETVSKGGSSFERRMNPDLSYMTAHGERATLRGRSLLFIRHVGLLMTTDAVVDRNGEEVPEGILDALITTLCSLHDIRGLGALPNSLTGAMYVVKPKMHGPDEVAFTVRLFERLERLLGLPPLTIKIGIMDEERRTSVNLRACIRAARERVVFINTGFLDRTGDEIHTSMHAGPFVRKGEMRGERWLGAYEAANVDVGLAAGLPGHAQIGKGMWAMPDLMAEMLVQKISHPRAGASTAWVPSPTAATLHALHYHLVDVPAVQRDLAARSAVGLDSLLTIPLAPAGGTGYTDAEKQEELDNNVQGILGYVVRWVDEGIGCSKVPDVHDVALMEDRATCRISSQHVANWLLHGMVTSEQVDESLRRMALVVDRQNDSASYRPMGDGFQGEAFLAARALIFEGLNQPSGYTEPILHEARRRVKSLEGAP
jgi:malate synthase